MIEKGDYVQVSNGAPEPPKHHKKKHRQWALRNFRGWVHRVQPDGGIAVDKSGKGMLVMVVNGAEVTKIE